jgi:hypothetical protein
MRRTKAITAITLIGVVIGACALLKIYWFPWGKQTYYVIGADRRVEFSVPRKYLRSQPLFSSESLGDIKVYVTRPSLEPYNKFDDPGGNNRIFIKVTLDPPMDHHTFKALLSDKWLDSQPLSEFAGLQVIKNDIPPYLSGKTAFFSRLNGNILIIICPLEKFKEAKYCVASTSISGCCAIEYFVSPRHLANWSRLHSSIVNLVSGWRAPR